MNIIEFNSIGGASGDMILATLIDLGADEKVLQARLNSLGIEPFRLDVRRSVFDGLRGVQVRVRIGEAPEYPAVHEHGNEHGHEHDNEHGHENGHGHGHEHGHDYDNDNDNDNKHGHGKAHGHAPHRGLKDIAQIVAGADLPPSVRDRSMAVFERLAQAEAHVHGTTPEKIHFHEVGAVDSIVDIVGACLALELLEVTDVAVTALPLGCGVIKCAHGLLPAPAPATVELLRGFPTLPTDEPFEMVTPTGAALLTAWRSLELAPAGCIMATGYGFGHARLRGRSNLLRAVLRRAEASAAGDVCLELECNLDDITPELVGALTEMLLAAGALDVYVIPAQMKKQRPGILLTVLCRPAQRAGMLDLLFRESTTFGVRERLVQRAVLERRMVDLSTPFGVIRAKVGTWRGCDVKAVPEYADCLAAAQKAGVPVAQVYGAALAAVQARQVLKI